MAACASWLSMLLEQIGVEIFKRFVLKEDYETCIENSKIPGIINDPNILTADIILLRRAADIILLKELQISFLKKSE